MNTRSVRFFLVLTITLAALASASAATVRPIARGLSAAIGQAFDPATQELFFVEWTSGELSKLNPATGRVTTVNRGFTNPQDVALFPGHPLAYVTTRDGKLWKVSTSGTAKREVASGLGMPHQLVLDPAGFVGYTVDFRGGNLYRVDLGSGASRALVTGLSSPLGLVMTPDYKIAYVAEPNRILKIDLRSGVQTVVVAGLRNAFFMDWADDVQGSLYLVERDPANRVSRVDLTVTPARKSFIANVASRPSSVVRSSDPNVLYVASDSIISKISFILPAGPTITAVGHIPSTEIDWTSGLATTNPAYFFYVKNASFGGTAHIKVNFPRLRSLGAKYYRVYIDGAMQSESWKNYKWNGTTFALKTVAPLGSGYYRVPAASETWSIPDLGFVMDTKDFANGRRRVYVVPYNASLTMIWGGLGRVAMQLDNAKPVFDIEEIWHDGHKLDECALITTGSANVEIVFTARDNEGHLLNYSLVDRWGSGHSAPVTSDQYIGVHDASPTWSGVTSVTVPYMFTNTACSHSFRLSGWANTTNGYGKIHHVSDLEHVAIFLGGPTCSP